MDCTPTTSSGDINDDFKIQCATDSMFVCMEMLKSLNYINDKPNPSPSLDAIHFGNEMANFLISMIEEFTLSEDEELFFEDNYVQSSDYHNEIENFVQETDFPTNMSNGESSQSSEMQTSTSSQDLPSSGSLFETDIKRPKFSNIPLDEKIRIIKIADANPNWSLSTLHKRGCSALVRKDELTRWKKQVQEGGTAFDKQYAITKWTLDRFIEALDNKKLITTRNLQEMAMQGAFQHLSDNFSFIASSSWIARFKRKFHIGQRKITRFMKPTEVKSLEKVLQDAENFQQECSELIKSYDLDYVLNTDQSGCEYRIPFNRTLTYRGQKRVEVNAGDINKISHSYAVQYTLTASGKLLPKVFLCMQEQTGSFGPQVQKKIDQLTAEFGNVFLTCLKSGKLNSQLFQKYSESILKPYDKDNKFILLLDSWSGHSKFDPFTEFTNENLEKTCTLKIIPPGCTPLAQPCDVYFYRQLKIFIKQLQNSTYLLNHDLQITSREDCIKIHALIHDQLSASAFTNMLKYAWYASKLTDERVIFDNVQQVFECSPSRIRYYLLKLLRKIK